MDRNDDNSVFERFYVQISNLNVFAFPLKLALDFLLEGHSLLMRTLHGEVQCKKDQNTPGISLCNHLEDLVKILSLWIYESPQVIFITY